MHLKDLMDRTLDDVTWLRDYGTISETLWNAYYFLWFRSSIRFAHYEPSKMIEEIQSALSPSDLITFQEYVENLKINA